ncbi:hypothetical protein [Tenacibaculum finnmarkense]|uniref:hypothetical protein n=1 Tax=Tenacibaculum finnmarkense TaxID=2781243 RepID=UPI001EFB7756|nr:hypothetical protein [Tenacibaculum finnmarkense]MCG8237190.1 hypothetical protein [Tenacibaculum finnmarkense genomovar ulcerans]MCG8803839.1 hypothetical protein [Tenacibaculum finnmarkense]MCG8826712.1 hypothetical protein [Tenacibaculum finnmarkense]MCG8831306.1 hypothetical protein [Tenacibaculum finnmarkense]
MEETIKIFIYIHAFFGGIGLITGIGSVIVKKGSPIHKRMGKFFSIGMITSSLISIPISWMPNHENLFLFLIGLFTIYLVLAGNRALTFKTKDKADWIDKMISGSMLFFSLIMIIIGIYGVLNNISFSILYLFFGGFGLFLTIKDFRFYKNSKNPKNAWLISHIGKMIGALIASITAFIIAGLGIGNLIAWILPTILGTFYIVYWKRKMKIKTVNN